MNTEQKQAGVPCKNHQCGFLDNKYEQNCSAGDEWDNPRIMDCENYIPVLTEKKNVSEMA